MLRTAIIILWAINIIKVTAIPIPIPNAVYYGSFALVALLLLIYEGRNCKISTFILLFVLTALLSTAFNSIVNPDIAFFKPLDRIAGFVMMMIAIGPLFIYANKEPQQLLYTLLSWSFTIITLLSFLFYILGMGFVYKRSMIVGVSIHAMILGPISGITMLNLIHQLFIAKENKIKVMYGMGIVIALLTCFLAGSRGALAAGLFSAAFLIFKQYSLRICTAILAATIIIGIFTVPVWLPYTETMQKKIEYASEVGHSSRDALWNDRIKEFEDSPIIGQGFASINRMVATRTPFSIVTRSLEPGSSWLFILSSLGIMGFGLFIAMLIKACHEFVMAKEYTPDIWHTAILFFFFVHFFIEGYVLHSGGILFVFFWLTLYMNFRSIYDKSFIDNKPSGTLYK